MGNGGEGGGKEEEVRRVASEREGGASGALERKPFVANEGHGIARPEVENQREDVGEDGVRQVVEVGGGGDGRRHVGQWWWIMEVGKEIEGRRRFRG